MTPLPLPATRIWLEFNYHNYSKDKLCIKLGIGSKQLEIWMRNMGLSKSDKKNFLEQAKSKS